MQIDLKSDSTLPWFTSCSGGGLSVARCGARHTSARPIVGIGPKSGLPLPPWLPHPSSRTPDAQYCRRPRPSPRSPGSLQRPSGALALRPSGPGPRLPESPTRLGTSLPPRLPAAGWRPRRSGPTGRRRGRRWRRWSATSSRTRSPGASRGCCSRGASARAASPPRRGSWSSSSTSSTVSACVDQLLARFINLAQATFN